MDEAYHYPPELFSLLVDAISKLNRSKADVLLFFRNAGVSNEITEDLSERLRTDCEGLKKHEIARAVLQRLNEQGDKALRARREVVKRISQWEDFTRCWSGDEMAARGLVGEVRRVVNVKDSFTRMDQAREKEVQQRLAEQDKKVQAIAQRHAELDSIRKEMGVLTRETDPHKRGKALEGLLNRLFRHAGILVKEAFTRTEGNGTGIIEQIDGVVEINGDLYLVEMKWYQTPLGPDQVSNHLVRIHGRGQARGIFISASGYTPAALAACRQYMQETVVVLCTLDEIVRLLEDERDLVSFLKAKIVASMVDKNPYHRIME